MKRNSIAIRWTVIGLLLVGGLMWLADRLRVGVPTERRIAEIGGEEISLEIIPEHYPPYQFVLGVPDGAKAEFHGSIEIRDPSGKVRTAPIQLEKIKACNWLDDTPGISGYILAWDRPQHFSDILERGKAYQVRVAFAETLPPGCSLWFHSMRRVSIIFGRDG